MRSHHLMPWLLLVAATVTDVLATFLLESSRGFHRVLPAALAVAAFALTIYLYGVAITRLTPSIAYALFGALGTALVGTIGICAGSQPRNWATFVGLALIIGGVAVLPLSQR
jgi:multidrug transporter EmrE-like cation transporter